MSTSVETLDDCIHRFEKAAAKDAALAPHLAVLKEKKDVVVDAKQKMSNQILDMEDMIVRIDKKEQVTRA